MGVRHWRGQRGISDSFRADNGPDKNHPNAVEVSGRRVKLPVIGWVRMREPLRFNGKVTSAVVSRTADRGFVSLWGGRLWRRTRVCRETGLGEAGIQLQSCLCAGLIRSGGTVSITALPDIVLTTGNMEEL